MVVDTSTIYSQNTLTMVARHITNNNYIPKFRMLSSTHANSVVSHMNILSDIRTNGKKFGNLNQMMNVLMCSSANIPFNYIIVIGLMELGKSKLAV